MKNVVIFFFFAHKIVIDATKCAFNTLMIEYTQEKLCDLYTNDKQQVL